MTRADRLIEGFKLGDLGAGKPTLASPSRFVIFKDDESGSQGQIDPYFFWQDDDNQKYALSLNRASPTTATIFFYAGESLHHTGRFLASYVIKAILRKTRQYDEALGLFNASKATVRKGGVQGLVATMPSLFQPVNGYEKTYKKWLKEKQGLIA